MNRSFVSAWVFYQSPLYCICIIVVVRVKEGTFSRKAVKEKISYENELTLKNF